MRVRAAILALMTAFGCSTPQSPAPRSVPVASAPPASPDAVVSTSAPDVPADPFADVKPMCRGTALAFDTEESEAPCLMINTDDHTLPPAPGPDALAVGASVVETSVAPGGTATVVVTMTNKTTAPMLLHVDMSCDDEPAFPISVLDANRKRVDFLSHKNCDTHTFGCTRRVLRIALEPGGSMRKTRSFATKVTKVVADCGDVPAGAIKPGRYTLRVVTGFEDDAGMERPTETTLVVK